MKNSISLFLLVFFLFVFFLLILPPAFSQRIAVLDSLVENNVDPSVQIPVTEKLIEVFVGKTNYTVIDRTDVQSVMSERKFQLSGMVKTEEIREVGHYLGADLICLAKVSLVGQTFFISVKMIDVENGTIVGQATDQSRGSIEVVLQLAEAAGIKLLTATGSLTDSSIPQKESSPQDSDSVVFLFPDQTDQPDQPSQPDQAKEQQDSAPSGSSGNSVPSRRDPNSQGRVSSLLMMGFSVPQFIGPAYDSLWNKMEGYYGSDIDRWGVGLRLRGFWPIASNMYIYTEGAGTTDNVDVPAEDDSMVSMILYEAVIGSGYHMPLGDKFVAYFGAGFGLLHIVFEIDTDVWDNYTADSVGAFAYNIELGLDYFSGPNTVFDFKVSITSGKLEDEELFGLSSEGLGAVNYSLMVGFSI